MIKDGTDDPKTSANNGYRLDNGCTGVARLMSALEA